MKRNWEININNPVQNIFMDWNWLMRNYLFYTGSHGGFLNLFQMKNETSQIEPEKVRQPFISGLKIESLIIDSIYTIVAKMSIWNGPEHYWNVGHLSIDEKQQPHGHCVFNLPKEHLNDTGKHEFLNWSIKSISGKFNHGKLNGIANLITWQGQKIWATFKEGILHGPAFQYGVTAILDMPVGETSINKTERLSV